MTHVIEERELRGPESEQLPSRFVVAGQGVRHHVQGTQLVFYDEIEAHKLGRPLMLGYGGETLVEDETKTPVIRADQEATAPEIRPLMPHGLDQADELPLVRRELGVAWRDGLAEEHHRTRALMKDRAKPGA